MTNVLDNKIVDTLKEGTVIPACPLALHEDRSFDEHHQRILPHYYIDSGAGGLAVGVHTTQFEIREHALYETVLRTVSEEINKRNLTTPFIKIAGISGSIEQAFEEIDIALKYGYDIALLNMAELEDYSEEELLKRTKLVANRIPVIGFYLQEAISNRIFSYEFWKEFMEIDNVVGVKVAPFDRYKTLDVLRAVAHSSRRDDIAVYTGNDDNIVADLLTTYSFTIDNEKIEIEFVGGLLGHWAVWTSKAVELLEEIKYAKKRQTGYEQLLQKGVKITDSNAAIFDTDNNFKGSIAGVNEVLAREGLLEGNYCLDDKEVLSSGQSQKIDRIYNVYPELIDNHFINNNIGKWQSKAKEKV